jgi:hypothetical protein
MIFWYKGKMKTDKKTTGISGLEQSATQAWFDGQRMWRRRQIFIILLSSHVVPTKPLNIVLPLSQLATYLQEKYIYRLEILQETVLLKFKWPNGWMGFELC